MRVFALFCAQVHITSAVQIGSKLSSSLFDKYRADFGREYARGSSEYSERLSLFVDRVKQIEAQNANPHRLWNATINAHTDRTMEELERLRGWRRSHHDGGSQGAVSLLEETVQVHHQVSKTVDWVHLDMAKNVFDQGECGSCWAVAATTMLQGRHDIAIKANRTFSIQQLVDCAPNPRSCGGTGGCDGATVELAMEYVTSAGLQQAEDAPYMGTKSACQVPPRSPLSLSSMGRLTNPHEAGYELGLRRWFKLPENRASPLMFALQEGPVAISVEAAGWFAYGSGVYNSCSKDAVIDHAVALFGYGTAADGVTSYWRVRNSWSRGWGEQGFIRLFRHRTPTEDENFCGVDNDPKSGVACKPYPTSVRVCGMCGILYDSVAAHFQHV